MRRYLTAVVLAAGAFVLGGLGTAVALPAATTGTWVPAGSTIVRVEGDKANGFGIHHYDGTVLYPPTDSEAFAECEEYDTRVAVVRCRTEVRLWYRDLGQMKRAIRWARYDASH